MRVPAYYDRCYHSTIVGLFRQNGFEVIETRFDCYQSQSFKFFLPLYLVSALHEKLLAAGVKDPCPHVLIVARKS